MAGSRTDCGTQLRDTSNALLAGEAPRPLITGSNTTIGVIATDAQITKVQAQRLATVGHDGLARSINPVHTMSDGDTLFALGTGLAGENPGMLLLATMAAEAVALATEQAVLAARSITLPDGVVLPGLADWSFQA